MSQEQKDALDLMLRGAPLDLGGDLQEQRATFAEMMSHVPAPEGVRVAPRRLGATSALDLGVAGAPATQVILYLHGGAFAIGSATDSVPLAGDLARRTQIDVVTIDYRLAPEHPFPAGLDDAVTAYEALLADGFAPGQIVVAGESAGAGLVMSMLLALRDADRPLPAAGFLMSPFADLTLSGDSLAEKASVDPALTAAGLRIRIADYVGAHDPAEPLVSPVFADLTGLPPLLIQVGSHEVLLSDAVRLAHRAGAADVDVRLEIVAGVPHVFQSFAAMLDEGSAALDRGAQFIVEHL